MSTFIQILLGLTNMRMGNLTYPRPGPLIISHWTVSTATKVLSLTRRPSWSSICQPTGVGGSKILGVLRSASLPPVDSSKGTKQPADGPWARECRQPILPAPRPPDPPPRPPSLCSELTTSRAQGKDSLQPSVAWKNAT